MQQSGARTLHHVQPQQVALCGKLSILDPASDRMQGQPYFTSKGRLTVTNPVRSCLL